jgi:molybdopterin/thiamine biosynthesis adenylyltransferase
MIDGRYSRQERFAAIGHVGQSRLLTARIAVVGCGALGTALLDMLVRAGVGHVRLIDRDFVEASNLQRQGLYDEADAAACTPKAVAAAARLARINSAISLEPVVAEVTARNVERLVSGVDLVLDGTDNFRTRHLLNEACTKSRVQWIYGACVGSYGLSLAILPGDGPCLACLQDQLPGPGETPTCDTAGVIAPIVHLVAAWQVADALRLLTGHQPRRQLWTCDVWQDRFQQVNVGGWRDPACAVCGPQPTYPQLSAPLDVAVTLCGRDSVQLTGLPLDLAALQHRLGAALIAGNEWLVRWRDGHRHVTAFRDGRLLVQGVADGAAARAVVDRWLG